MKDILMYADDIMTLCTSQDQLNKAIRTIEDWTFTNFVYRKFIILKLNLTN